MTKDVIEQILIGLLQSKIKIYSQYNKLIKEGKLTLINIKEFNVQFNLLSADGDIVYEIPYPYAVFTQNSDVIVDYRLETFCKNNELLEYKIKINPPQKINKLYDTYLRIEKVY